MQVETTPFTPSPASEKLIDIITDLERSYWRMMATGAYGADLDPDLSLGKENREHELRFINYPCRNARETCLKINYILSRQHSTKVSWMISFPSCAASKSRKAVPNEYH